MRGAAKSGVLTGGGLLDTVLAAAGLYFVVQFILKWRRKAQHPSMVDPARRLMTSLRTVPPVLLVALVAVNVLAVAIWGLVAAIALIAIDALALIAAGVGVLVVWERAERLRRTTGYVISELEYPAAPRQVKSAMRRILRSARSIRAGRAYVDGMFGDMELDELVYAAAERAVLSSELSAAVTDLKPDAIAADKEVLDRANEQIDEIIAYLGDVERSLQAGARASGGLSDQMARPQRERDAAQRVEAAAQASAARRRTDRARVEDAITRASAKTPIDPSDIEDRIHAVRAGFQEAAEISRAARFQPNRSETVDPARLADGDVEVDRTAKTRSAAWKTARSAANATAKASTAAAKATPRSTRNDVTSAGNRAARRSAWTGPDARSPLDWRCVVDVPILTITPISVEVEAAGVR